MCVTCGCGHPKKDHGDPRNLTRDDFNEAAKAAKIDVHHLVANINDAYRQGELSPGHAKPDEHRLAPAALVRRGDAERQRDVELLKNAAQGVIKSTVNEVKRYTLGVAYAPNHPDVAVAADGRRDMISPEELEEAAWRFMAHRDVGIEHRPGPKAGTVVESYIYRGPKWVVSDRLTVVPGTWLVGIVWEPWAWADVQAGRIRGLSPQGSAHLR